MFRIVNFSVPFAIDLHCSLKTMKISFNAMNMGIVGVVLSAIL